MTVTPVNDAEWTHYDVVDMDGKVTVSALKNDVYIDARSKNPQQAKQSAHSSRITVREGEQKSREEKCGGADDQPKQNFHQEGAPIQFPLGNWRRLAGIGLLVAGPLP